VIESVRATVAEMLEDRLATANLYAAVAAHETHTDGAVSTDTRDEILCVSGEIAALSDVLATFAARCVA
jgi:hypothetical protein